MSLLLRPCDWISSLHTSVHHLHSLGSIPTYTILFRDWVSNREPCGSLSSDESTRTRHQTNLAMRTGPHTHAAYDYYCMHCCVNCSDKCNCALEYLPSQPPCQPGRTAYAVSKPLSVALRRLHKKSASFIFVTAHHAAENRTPR